MVLVWVREERKLESMSPEAVSGVRGKRGWRGRCTVHLPVLFLAVLLEVSGEEDVLGLDPLQVFGHLVC